MKFHNFLPVKTVSILAIILIAIGLITSGFMNGNSTSKSEVDSGNINKDSIQSVLAFRQVYKVLISPRCMNCHPSGDVPLQGDDSHLHNMLPRRGSDGKGIYAMKCSNCHQSTNIAGLHTPPGNPKWHLPPADMKMVFQGRNAHQLAAQILDYNRNGHKNKEQLLEHARDTLVRAGWHMGVGKKSPPMPYEDFVAAWDTWIKKGAYIPK